MGILSVVAIVSVNKVIQNAKVRHYTTAEDQMKLAGQSYVQQNRSALPKAIGQMVEIKLNTLVKGNYISQIQDYSKNNCDLDKSVVKVFKYSQTEYSYSVYLECPEYKSTENSHSGGPDLSKSAVEGTDMATSQQLHFVAEDDDKLISYSYVIFKNGKEAYNSGSIMLKDYPKKFDRKFSLRDYVPSNSLKIVVTATNIFGLTKKRTLTRPNCTPTSTDDCGFKFEDKDGPECVYLNPADKVDKPWTNVGPIKITVGCNDGSGTGCTRSEYSKTFKDSIRYGEIVIEDKAGHVTACPVSIFYDVTSPSIKVVAYNLDASGNKGSKVGEMTADNAGRNKTLDLSNGNTKWFNKTTSANGIMLEVTYSDGESPVTFTAVQNGDGLSPAEANDGLAKGTGFTQVESATTTGNSQTKQYKITKDGYKIFKIVGKDEIGNQTSINVIVPLDRVAPTKPTVTNANDDKWATVNYNITATSKDTLSGVKSIQYTRKSDATTVTTDAGTGYVEMPSSGAGKNADANGTQLINYDGSYTGRVRACDVAGNCSEVTTTKIKLDTVKPAKPTLTVTGKNPITVKMTSSDATSGIAYFESRVYNSGSGYTAFAEKDKATITITTNNTLEIRAVDKAGNVSDSAVTRHCNVSGGTLKNDSKHGWICEKSVNSKTESYMCYGCCAYNDCCPSSSQGAFNGNGYLWKPCDSSTMCTSWKNCEQERTVKYCDSGFNLADSDTRCIKTADGG